MADDDALGLVVGTVPATPLQFSVGLAPGQYVAARRRGGDTAASCLAARRSRSPAW